jgi:membrane associated rhomboid family serine protease
MPIRNPSFRHEAVDPLHLPAGSPHAALNAPVPGLTFWRFVAVLLSALLLGTTFSHVLEMPAKLRFEPQLWMTLQHNLYVAYGSIGALTEIGAIAAVLVLAVLVRQRTRSLWLTLIAAVCLLVAFGVVWLVFTSVVNAETARWTAATIPPDWARWRTRWEFSHALRFALHLAGFCALTLSVLIDPRPARQAALPAA